MKMSVARIDFKYYVVSLAVILTSGEICWKDEHPFLYQRLETDIPANPATFEYISRRTAHSRFFVYGGAKFELSVEKTVLHFACGLWYTINEVRNVRFNPFVYDQLNTQIPVTIDEMTQPDAEATNLPPIWQTSWTSEYLSDKRFEKYAAKVGEELIALGAYEVLNTIPQ